MADSRGIDANEFKIISTEKLLEIKKQLEEIIEAGAGTRIKLQENQEGKYSINEFDH